MNANERLVKRIIPKSEDFSKWYLELIRKAELVDYAPMKGMMIIRPYGFALWENIQRLLDRRFKETGHVNAYFPLFIPESFLRKEAEHVEGFAPEVAWVTHGGGEELEERLAVRPTSEAIIGPMYSKWIKSYRDLPVLINQWANIVRWEKVTRPFLRTTEFLWQEGHTVHETFEEAQEETLRILDLYREFAETELAVPVLSGEKSAAEKFAGAHMTYAIEGLMTDGKALQMGTTHNLGQHFARAFNIRYEDRNQVLQYAWQTSWGVSTRLVGAVVMVHGDDSGLVFPPNVAPEQIVVVPIAIGSWKETVLPEARRIEARLRGVGCRIRLDAREEFTPGWKFAEHEMRGVPLRIEIGPRDLKEGKVVFVRRDTAAKEGISIAAIEDRAPAVLDEIQQNLFAKALRFREENTRGVRDYDEFKEVIETKRGFLTSYWCGNPDCEARIKADTMATIRIIPMSGSPEASRGSCVICGRTEAAMAYFARSY